jgi:hypothetical protein
MEGRLLPPEQLLTGAMRSSVFTLLGRRLFDICEVADDDEMPYQSRLTKRVSTE